MTVYYSHDVILQDEKGRYCANCGEYIINEELLKRQQMSKDWRDKYISKLKVVKTDKELLSIIDSIYELGYDEGLDMIDETHSEPTPWEDLD